MMQMRQESDKIVIVEPSVSAEAFYNKFIKKRVPAKFDGHIIDRQWKGHLWSNAYLNSTSGDNIIKVERRSGPNHRFGQGNEVNMPFNEFLAAIERGDESFYLTTQELQYNHEGQPSITSPPVDGLIGDFPWVPTVCGHLVPQNINLWFGSAKIPTTTGMHHDFHDNLYILLRGEKRFTLVSPHEADNMYTIGEITTIHPNGRINYKGQPTRADGSDIKSLEALEAAKVLDKAASELQKAEEGGNSIDVDAVEQEIEDALEAVLNAEIEGEDHDDDVGSDNGGDEEEWEEEEEEADDDDEEEDIGDDLDDEGAFFGFNSGGKRKAKENEHDHGRSSSSADGKVDRDDGKLNETLHVAKKPKTTGAADSSVYDNASNDRKDHLLEGATSTKRDPSHFCRVDTSAPPEELKQKFPKFWEILEQGRYIDVTVKAGEMLYIPAGWFHEVRSSNTGPEGHMAFNYWFHPPDGESFEKPYATDFWPEDWKRRGLC